jgi:hypothetical protein
MRAFVFGSIVGACACFAVLRIVDPPLAQPALVEPLPDRPTQAVELEPNQPPSCPDVPSVTLAHAKQPEPKATAEQPAARDDGNSQSVPSAPVTVAKKSITLADLTEEAAGQLCIQAERLRHQREQAAKAAEPKDAGWAYSMEQLIRQHLESHIPADKYKILQLECRTTFCELRMEGTDKEGLALVEKVANDIPNQPWSDIAQKGGGSGSAGDQWHLERDWYRPTTESERRMWLRQRN